MGVQAIDVFDTCPFGPAEDPVSCHLRSCPLKLNGGLRGEYCSIAMIGVMSANIPDIKEALEDIAFAVREIAGAMDNGEWTAPITKGQ